MPALPYARTSKPSKCDNTDQSNERASSYDDSCLCRHLLVLLFPVRGGNALYLPGEMDGRVLGLSAAISLGVTLAVGLVPAFQTRDLALGEMLKTGASGVMGARGRAWFRASLVVLQVALSFIFWWARAC